MPGLFSGKVALVTGGGSGMGRAAALAFARQGASVVVADIDAAGGEVTARRIQDSGGDGLFVLTDVSQASSVEALIATTVTAYGRLDCAFTTPASTSSAVRSPRAPRPCGTASSPSTSKGSCSA